jgi:hypothetical protein
MKIFFTKQNKIKIQSLLGKIKKLALKPINYYVYIYILHSDILCIKYILLISNFKIFISCICC